MSANGDHKYNLNSTIYAGTTAATGIPVYLTASTECT